MLNALQATPPNVFSTEADYLDTILHLNLIGPLISDLACAHTAGRIGAGKCRLVSAKCRTR